MSEAESKVETPAAPAAEEKAPEDIKGGTKRPAEVGDKKRQRNLTSFSYFKAGCSSFYSNIKVPSI